MRRTIIALDRQSLFDIAVQEYGSVEGAIDVLLDDPTTNKFVELPTGPAGAMEQHDLGLMSPLVAGQNIVIRTSSIDEPTYQYYFKRRLHPITDYTYDLSFLDDDLPDFNEDDFNPDDFN